MRVNAVLKALPGLRESLAFPGGALLNNRGLFLPKPLFGEAMTYVVVAFGLGIVAAIAFRVWARRRQMRTGEQPPVLGRRWWCAGSSP